MLKKIKKISKLKKIINFNYKVKGFLSIEVIFIMSILGFFIHKITGTAYVWIKKFYIFNSILITVNGYIQLSMPVNKTLDTIKIIYQDNSLKITSEKKEELKSLSDYLNKNVNNKELLIINENEITVKSLNDMEE
jgi:hypothetical protein